MSNMGWKTISSKTIYDNPWMTVLEDRVLNPSGGQNDYGHIRFKNRAVAIIPIDENNDTWLVGQDRYTLGEYSWELPMGGAPKSENPLDAAKRELREETGLTARHWTEIMRVHLSNSITDEEGLVYVARELQPGETQFGETEDLKILKLPLSEAVEKARSGELTDVMTVAGLLKIGR